MLWISKHLHVIIFSKVATSFTFQTTPIKQQTMLVKAKNQQKTGKTGLV
jgi:hypothetical protein